MEPIEIGNLVPIIPGDLIQVPHCEPPSAASSLRFSAYYAQSNCASGLVALKDALDALPGSEVVYGVNFGPPNHRTRWLRMPPLVLQCPCADTKDWYGILRDLPRVDLDPDPGPCSLETSQWCNETRVPDADPRLGPNTYFQEGEYPMGVSHLPLITSNQVD